jgi:hypothetical protein
MLAALNQHSQIKSLACRHLPATIQSHATTQTKEARKSSYLTILKDKPLLNDC